MDLNEVVYQRSIYTLLDLFGDIGGLFDMLMVIGNLYYGLICLLIGSRLNRYLIKKIFYMPSKGKFKS